jgi:hypothetical protein
MIKETKYLVTQCIVSVLDIAGIGMLISQGSSFYLPGYNIVAGISVFFILIGIGGIWTKHSALIRWNLWLACIAIALLGYLSAMCFLSESIGAGIGFLIGAGISGVAVAGCHYLYRKTPAILKIQAKVGDQTVTQMESVSTPKEIQIHSLESRQRSSPTKTQIQ